MKTLMKILSFLLVTAPLMAMERDQVKDFIASQKTITGQKRKREAEEESHTKGEASSSDACEKEPLRIAQEQQPIPDFNALLIEQQRKMFEGILNGEFSEVITNDVISLVLKGRFSPSFSLTSSVGIVKDSHLKNIHKAFPNLTSLDADYQDITFEGAEFIIQNFLKLESVSIDGCFVHSKEKKLLNEIRRKMIQKDPTVPPITIHIERKRVGARKK